MRRHARCATRSTRGVASRCRWWRRSRAGSPSTTGRTMPRAARGASRATTRPRPTPAALLRCGSACRAIATRRPRGVRGVTWRMRAGCCAPRVPAAGRSCPRLGWASWPTAPASTGRTATWRVRSAPSARAATRSPRARSATSGRRRDGASTAPDGCLRTARPDARRISGAASATGARRRAWRAIDARARRGTRPRSADPSRADRPSTTKRGGASTAATRARTSPPASRATRPAIARRATRPARRPTAPASAPDARRWPI